MFQVRTRDLLRLIPLSRDNENSISRSAPADAEENFSRRVLPRWYCCE